MRFYIFYLVSFFFCQFLFAQEKIIKVDWFDSQTVDKDGVYEGVPSAKNMDIGIHDSRQFRFFLAWESINHDFENAKIKNLVYEDIDVTKLVNLNKEIITDEINFSIDNRKTRGKNYSNLSFTPIIKMNGVYKKVISFVLEAESNSVTQASNRRGKSLSTNEVLSSVLRTGDWYKFRVNTTGVYKITPQFLSSLGIDLDNVNANSIKIYGNGGQALPLANSEEVFFDVPENPVKIIGGEDGVFSGDDYLLFYGRGTQGFVSENRSHINPYDDNAYYYVTYGGNSGKKITEMVEPTASPTRVFNTYNYHSFYEVDLFNLGQLGRIWHGDRFNSSQSSRDYQFDFPELASGTNVSVDVRFSAIYGASPQLVSTIISSNSVLSTRTSIISGLNTRNNAYSNITQSQTLDSENVVNSSLSVNLNYLIGSDISSEGFLDFIAVDAECNLQGQNKQFSFSNMETNSVTGIGQFQVANTSNINSFWDVSDPYNISEKTNSGRAGSSTLNFALGSLKTFVAVDLNDLYEPETVSNSKINNQDVKGTVFLDRSGQFQDIDYLILTNSEFLSAANRLASFRSENDGFVTKVIDVDLIYNEFSSGKKDIGAIRNLVKYIYDNASNEESKLKYLCLIGDGSYDYKNRISSLTNNVPLYHALESSSLTSSYASDDFYCFMDDNEGGNPNIDKMDLSVGRMLVRNSEEANTMVDKVISYYDRDSYGDWRNSVLFLSDDVDVNTDAEIQEKIIEISDTLENKIERINVKRILTDSYVQVTSSGGERYDDAKSDLEDAFELGMSYINYFGHGGEDGITGEFIFSSESAQNLTNQKRLPVFVTLTCELTRFDNPNRLTAGEFLYWNPVGGAVALLTTTRNLFLRTGLNLNDSLEEALFDQGNNAIPIGDAIRLAKNSLSGANARTVFCIGDPAISIALPEPEVELTEVNGINFNEWESGDNSLEALSRVNLKGRVVNGSGGALLNSYNGRVTLIVFDKGLLRTTLGNDGIREGNELITVEFTESDRSVFKGLASVINGEFSFDFILPKNVVLEKGEGKVSFYVENDQVLEDQSGAQKVTIGGLNANAEVDNEAPVIQLFIDDETFSSGQVVSSSPSIFAKLSDVSGINTAGGVGHDIVAILDGDEANPIVLNEYYSANLDDFTSGQLIYELNDLDPGEHTLSLRASDTHNNSSFEEILFVINEVGDFSLSKVLNYPNPFVSYTEFWFSHNSLSNDTLEVSVQVMTVTGKIVTVKFATLSGESNYRAGLTWDGKDDFGNKLGKGVYVYKITVKSTLTNKTTSKFEKLVIL